MQFQAYLRLAASVGRSLRSRQQAAAFALTLGLFGCAERSEPLGEQRLAATFPVSASAWTPVPQAGAGISDPLADGMNNGREIVGSATDAAVYVYTDGVDFFVRLRVDDDPSQASTVRPFGWGLLIDTNNDFAAYEYSLMVDGTGSPKSVVLAQNTTPGTTGDPNDKAETILSSSAVNTAAGGNVRITAASTSFNTTPDFFLDFAVPLLVMKAAGFGLDTPFRVVAGTSSSGNSISVDVAGTANAPGPGILQEAASDTISLTGGSADTDGDGVFNPTDLDDDNDGIPDKLENLLTLDPDGDADSDGVPNWQDATNQGNGIVSTCVDAAADGLCDVPSSVYDTDRDGIPNHHDLDSDDDGIPDIAEAGHRGTDANTDGMVDGPYGTNGWANSLETVADSGLASFVLLDTNNDDQPDFVDLDSDGDGKFDLAEVGKNALDTNADGRIDASSPDADKDGIRAGADADETKYGFPSVAVGTFNADTDGIPDPYDPLTGAASDSDGDGLTDAAECVGGWPCPDTNQDGTPNYMVGLLDTDGDGVPNNMDLAPSNPNVCKDTDADSCDDCAITGANGSGGSVTNDGLDTDADGRCNAGDTDDDNDGVLDGTDSAPLNPKLCKDTDADSCDDCAVTGGNASGGSVTNDGLDTDADGQCNAGDTDDDNDGALDGADSAPLNPNLCKDSDADSCDDCAVTGADSSGGSITNDGPDVDADGKCDAGDPDSDNDGVADAGDSAPLNPNVCKDTDADGCDDCAVTGANSSGGSVSNDGLDSDADGLCNAGDDDDDNDGVSDGSDGAPLDPSACRDADADTCDDCAVTQSDGSGGDPDNDGPDADADGTCDAGSNGNGDGDGDGDGVPNADDLDADNDGIPNARENLAWVDPLGDADDDDVPNFQDSDDRGDGKAAACSDAESNGACDSLDPLFDTDEDGVPNHLDLDSDGDSISDLDEAGHDGTDANRDGRLEGPVGANGLNDALETASESGVIDYDLSNVDGDVAPDFIDIDSDGDNIGDAEEAGDDDPATSPVDSDGDTIADYRDADSDDDGIDDRDEAGDTDLATPAVDTDDDGKPDYLDEDSDDDGLSDGTESGDTDLDTPAIDSDDDGVPDFQDPDSDGDGVVDGADDCRLVANPNQADTDDNGVGDACEGDADADSVPDADDNCPNRDNPDQADEDGDGVGDACDDAVVTPTEGTDSDDDGVADEDDDCPNVADPAQTDRDHDGMGDRCDRDANGDGFDDDVGVQGGGCSVSTPSGAGNAWGTGLLAMLGMTLAGRARRRRRATRAALLGVGVAGLLTGRSAQAQDTQIPAERFRLASTREGILDVESGKVGKQLSFDVGLWLGYAKDPLTVYREQSGNDEQLGALIGDRFGGALVGAVAIVDQLQLGLTLPLVLAQQESGGTGIPNASPDSFGLGNLEVTPKLQVLRQDQVGLDISLLVGVMLPTTTSDDYFGDDGFVATPELALSRNFGKGVHGAINAGYRFRKRARLLNLRVNDEIMGRAGLAYRFKDNGGPPLELGITGSTATAAGHPFETPNRDYAELLFGAGYDIVSTEGKTMKAAWQLFGAGGVGLARGFGTPEYRALLGVRLAVGPVDEPPPPPPAIGPVDSDGDGLLDNVDKCPREPEVKNGFQDEDGCPDAIPDTDGDGLRDPDDKCPQEPEDKDTFQDEDGCPDPDNDADGILDTDDKCPVQPGPTVTRGCPDPDRDKDSVVDRLDNCPDEPGKPELQGCKEKQLVRIAETSIDILEVVQFEYNKAVIQKRSFKLLDDVARVIVAHPELEHIRVEGHTDDRGNDDYNKKLSQGRADSVRRYLIEHGVAENRLEAVGYGEEKPIGDNKTEAGRTQNRRVEFKIVDAKARTSGAP